MIDIDIGIVENESDCCYYGDSEDMEYFLRKMHGALSIPNDYLK